MNPFQGGMLMKICAQLFFFTAAAVLAANAWAVESPPPIKSPSIKIGVAGALSGDLVSYGQPTARAAELVAEQINAKGGINGAKVELQIEDDVCKPEVAANIAAKLVSAGVKVVIGHICSSATKAALPVYTDADVTLISPSATDSDLTESGKYPHFYRTIAPNNAQARTIVDFAIKLLKDAAMKKIAIIHDKGDYGKGLAEDAREAIRKNALADVVLFEGITPGAVDYSAVVQKIRRTRAEAVIFGGYHPEASKIITQMRKKDMKTFFISDDGVKDDTFIRIAGKYAEGAYATGPADVSENPVARQYRQAYLNKYGSQPGAFFDNAVAAAIALTNAVEKAGSTDADKVADILHSQIAVTPFGEIRFDLHGDATGVGYTMYQVKDGKFVQPE